MREKPPGSFCSALSCSRFATLEHPQPWGQSPRGGSCSLHPQGVPGRRVWGAGRAGTASAPTVGAQTHTGARTQPEHPGGREEVGYDVYSLFFCSCCAALYAGGAAGCYLHPNPGQRGLGRESRLAKGPGWEIFPWGSFSVGSELSREEPRESVAVRGALNSAERWDRPSRPLAAAVAVFSSFPMGIWLPAWGCRDPINETQEQRPATCGNPGSAGSGSVPGGQKVPMWSW